MLRQKGLEEQLREETESNVTAKADLEEQLDKRGSAKED